MEYKTIIFNAARDGNLRRIKVFMENRKKEEIEALLSSSTFGTPPLVIASRNGHYDVCEYLLSKGAEVEQQGSVSFDGENIEGSRPLWCAAAAGHLNVCKLLVSKYKANVNNTTVTNSTPLRAACFDGHLEIVKFLVEHGADMEIANRHGHTSLMIACYRGHVEVVRYLLSRGANVNRKSTKGNTALHDCAESGSLEILKLLLENGARLEPDAYGLTPLLAAACLGHAAIVSYLVDYHGIRLQEKVDALELLGANYVDKRRDIIGALGFWRRAILMRKWSAIFEDDEPPNVEQAVAEAEEKGVASSDGKAGASIRVLLKAKMHKPVAAYRYMREIETTTDLDNIRGDPDACRMQALLIRERVLGAAHPDVAYFIRYRGAIYADLNQCRRCLELWFYALDLQQSTLEPLCAMTLSSFISFVELFSFMLNDNSQANNNNNNNGRQEGADHVPVVHHHAEDEDDDDEDEEVPFGEPAHAAQDEADEDEVQRVHRRARAEVDSVSFDDFLAAIERACLEIRRALSHEDASGTSEEQPPADACCAAVSGLLRCKHSGGANGASVANLHKMCVVALHLICQICRLETRMSAEEELRFKRVVYGLVQMAPRGNNEASLLHMACSAESSTLGRFPVCRFPALNVVQLLIAVGADVNAIDRDKNTPLHVILAQKVSRPSITTLLLDNGAHIDRRNSTGRTPLDLLKTSTLDVAPMNYLKLSCLAAQVVKKHGIIYRTHVPSTLHAFIELH